MTEKQSFEQRVEVLKPYATTGLPTHVRGVAECIIDARRFLNWGEKRQAEYFLTQAEVFAGLRGYEDMHRLVT
jgi:hypothetical protein